MIIPPNTRFVLIGDSITDCGRDRKTPASPWDSSCDLGNGYVDLLDALLKTSEPESNIRILNRGIGGNTVRDLALRWKRDVLDLAPDWLSIKIGINDVWRQFDSPRSPHVHVLPAEFESTYRDLLSLTRPRLKQLVLVTPYYIEPELSNPMRARMDEYRNIVKAIAQDFDAILVDTQHAIDRLMLHIAPTDIASDHVHPGTLGHMAIARAILAAIESE